MANTLIILGSVVTAILTIGGVAVAIIKWVLNQNKQSDDIVALKKKHDEDMAATKEQEKADVQAIKDELCVLSYAMLAALDGLKQLHCNGEVTKAHDRLEKHLNQTAHGQTRTTKL
ncbi:MAG: branched-chain amino acid ABC transporter permease [Clostridia bacterium]|nr:branched-chain amino acid ABC transporter permease [Clostridia bacterium]